MLVSKRSIQLEKSRKWPKTSICAIIWRFRGQIAPNCKIFLKFFIFSANFRPKTKKIVRAVFEKNIIVSDFRLIWRTSREYLQIMNFFWKIRLCHFSSFIPPNFMQKVRKIYSAVSEKTALPTNKQTITNNNDFLGPGWHRSNTNVSVLQHSIF